MAIPVPLDSIQALQTCGRREPGSQTKQDNSSQTMEKQRGAQMKAPRSHQPADICYCMPFPRVKGLMGKSAIQGCFFWESSPGEQTVLSAPSIPTTPLSAVGPPGVCGLMVPHHQKSPCCACTERSAHKTRGSPSSSS